MVAPGLCARIEKRNYLTSHRINGRQIRAFVVVTNRAGQSQIIADRLPPVLERYHVVDLM